MAAEMARRPFTPGLGTFRSATSLGHSLAHFLPAPTGTGWVEKGKRPRLDDSELMVKAEGPGERVSSTQALGGLPQGVCAASPHQSDRLSWGHRERELKLWSQGLRCDLLRLGCGGTRAAGMTRGERAESRWSEGQPHSQLRVCQLTGQRSRGPPGPHSPPCIDLAQKTVSWAGSGGPAPGSCAHWAGPQAVLSPWELLTLGAAAARTCTGLPPRDPSPQAASSPSPAALPFLPSPSSFLGCLLLTKSPRGTSGSSQPQRAALAGRRGGIGGGSGERGQLSLQRAQESRAWPVGQPL